MEILIRIDNDHMKKHLPIKYIYNYDAYKST